MGYSVVSSVTGSVAGLVTTTRVGYRPQAVIWVPWAIAAVGYVCPVHSQCGATY